MNNKPKTPPIDKQLLKQLRQVCKHHPDLITFMEMKPDQRMRGEALVIGTLTHSRRTLN